MKDMAVNLNCQKDQKEMCVNVDKQKVVVDRQEIEADTGG